MKIKDGFVITNIDGKSVVSVSDSTQVNFNGLVILNSIGLEIWKILQKGASYDDLTKTLIEKYNVELDVLKRDIDSFLRKISFAIEESDNYEN